MREGSSLRGQGLRVEAMEDVAGIRSLGASRPADMAGRYRIRLARTDEEIAVAQKLRYAVFYEEMNARPDPATRASGRDADRYDGVCDHLIIVDEGGSGRFALDDGAMAGTYRLLPQDRSHAAGGFYTASEYDIAPLLARKGELNFLELGRSCVLKDYRTRAIINLLWQGIWDYVRAGRFDVMFGCASFPGADPERHRAALAYLARHHMPPPEWQARALPTLRVAITGDGRETVDARQVARAIPPLIKGYLALGCYIGDGAVIDQQFDTTDVLIILPVANINPRYFERFGQPVENRL
jgi:L-ornithine Nalpha-acyltransferase